MLIRQVAALRHVKN